MDNMLPANSNKTFLFYYCITAGVISLLINANRIDLAGSFLGLTLALSFIYSLSKSYSGAYFTMIIFVYSPFLSYLRQYVVSYNFISVILILTLLLWLLTNRELFTKIFLNKANLGIVVFIFLFILYGLMSGNPFNRFAKFFETLLAMQVFSMLLRSLFFVRRYIIYFVFSSALLIISLLQHISTRFAIETNQGSYSADPSGYSIALVLSAFFISADNNLWITQFDKYPLLKKSKNLLLSIVVILTILTTSRIGFFALAGSYSIFLIFEKFKIKLLSPIVLTIFLSFLYLSNSNYSKIVEKWTIKTFSNNQGIAGATSGRSDQWEMTGLYLMKDIPSNILFGYGPGNGPKFSEKYSKKVNSIASMYGKSYELHSLYLNILIEFGLFAFIIFMFFLLKRLKQAYVLYMKIGIQLPFLATTGYLIYIGSVSGLGLVSGMFIALILLPVHYLHSK